MNKSPVPRRVPRELDVEVALADDPLWFRDAVIYELHVRAFADSNGDGIGDFPGLVDKLDYLQDLGVTAIWLLPFYPSPLRDDGYDIADYCDVHPSYGTLADFKRFLKEAHRRGLRVITELVVNHTSDRHPWFERARRSPPGSKHRDFYVWSDSPEPYKEARIIFQDFEHSNWAWDPVANQYYWHRFYSHQPDLNFDNPAVKKALFKVVDFWLGMGIDGMRLDAVPYLFEREGTNCENLPETHAFLKELRAHIDSKFKNRMLLAEANQWPEDAASYFGDGDECHMNFHFPLMPRLFMAVRLEDSFPVLDILEQTPDIPNTCQWAVFLRNHDELTLEMVTDEDRDHMYRFYAEDPKARINLGIRRRLVPLLKDRRKVELLNALLCSLPGTPVLYYGDEIGMGDNFYLGDRDAVRTPMQWNGDRNAGFSQANPQQLFLPVIIDPEYHYQALNVETQQNNPTSLLWWMKRLIALRKEHQAFGRGSVTFLHPDNPKVLAFVREFDGERILVVANLSHYAQFADLDLSAYEGQHPVELFGRTEFPPIGDELYRVTLGPHVFYWFQLQHPDVDEGHAEILPTLQVADDWAALLKGRKKQGLERILPAWLQRRRWFRGKAKGLRSVSIIDVIEVPNRTDGPRIALLRADYRDQTEQVYVLPLAFSPDDKTDPHHQDEAEEAAVARVEIRSKEGKRGGLLYDASVSPRFAESMLAFFSKKRPAAGHKGEMEATSLPPLRRLLKASDDELEPRVIGAEQSNTSIAYGSRLIFKLYRHLEEGENPDIEVGRYLTEDQGFAHTPSVAGWLNYRRGRTRSSMGILQELVQNHGDAWRMTLDSLALFFEAALGHPAEAHDVPLLEGSLFETAGQELPDIALEMCGTYLSHARLLGQRTAEMHLALAAAKGRADFVPEPFSTLYQRSLYQAGRTQVKQTLALLKRELKKLPEELQPDARAVLEARDALDARLRAVTKRKFDAVRVRCHGDYHLGQVLFTGNDFAIIDFEGEPARAIGERRLKRAPLRDVAGMIRSFAYAPAVALRDGPARREDVPVLEKWAARWQQWVVTTFLGSYADHAGESRILPASVADSDLLLDYFLIEKCVYELAYELNNRPTWVDIPLAGLQDLLD